ncbi:MAG: phage portal protein [Chloroflexota bacterium]|nr:phage portal protein [Chloroflexota bacterium]
MREYLAQRDGLVGRMAGQTGTEVEEITEHPILDRFRHPTSNPDSPFRGIRSLIYFTQLGKEIVGSSYWSFSVDGLGMPAEILPLPPASVRAIPFAAEQPDGRVISHFIGPNGHQLAVETIAWFRFLSLGNPYGAAYSPAEACYQELGIVDKHAASAETVFDNGFHPSAVISAKNADRPLGEDAAQRLDKRLEKGFSRARANRPIVEPTGALQVDPYPSPRIDTGGVEVSRSAKMIIANAFDVPLTMLETTDSNKASAGEGNKAHLVNAISPRCEFMAEDLTGWMHRLGRTDPVKDIHGDLGWHRAFLAFDNPVPSDEAAQSKRLVSFVGVDILRKDEARAELGYGPHEDGAGMEPVKTTTPTNDQADKQTPKGKTDHTDDEDND